MGLSPRFASGVAVIQATIDLYRILRQISQKLVRLGMFVAVSCERCFLSLDALDLTSPAPSKCPAYRPTRHASVAIQRSINPVYDGTAYLPVHLPPSGPPPTNGKPPEYKYWAYASYVETSIPKKTICSKNRSTRGRV